METLGRAVTRRAVMQGLGVGALGLAGAALLGCGGRGPAQPGAGAPEAGKIQGASSGGGLPLNAPVVQGKVKEGGVFNYAAATQNKQFDPHTSLGDGGWGIVSEKGLNTDPRTGKIRSSIFTSWEVADPSGTTLMFKVDPHLYVQNRAPWNGRQFTAEDAAWNLERIGGLYAERTKIPLSSFQRASMVGNITKAVAVDPLTVKVTLSKPNSSFFNGLWDTRVMFMPREMDDIGYKDPMKQAGIGPYMLTEWVNDVSATYTKNPRYTEFRQGQPHLDQIRHQVVPDTGSIQAAFYSGQTQSVSTPTSDLIATARKAKPDANLYTWVDSNWQHIRPSVEYGPFKDFRVRKAMFLAMDYKEMADTYYGSEGGWAYQAALCPGYPEAWSPDKVKSLAGYNPATKVEDRKNAAQMLAAAGYPNGKGLDFEIIFQGPSDNNNINATRAHNQLTTTFTDMKMKLHPYPDSASFAVPQAEGKFQMLSYTITAAPDAVVEFVSQYYTGGSRNYGHFSDKGLDALMDKAQVELNQANRTKMMDEAQQRFIDEWMPMYVLYAGAGKQMVQGNIGGFDQLVGVWWGYRGPGSGQEYRNLYYVEK